MVSEWDLPTTGLRGLASSERRRFWDGYEAARRGVTYAKGNNFSRWRAVGETDLNIALYITNRSVGLFVRGVRGTPLAATRQRLGSARRALERSLGARLDDECPLLHGLAISTSDPSNWPKAYAWLAVNEERYLNALSALSPRPSAEPLRAFPRSPAARPGL